MKILVTGGAGFIGSHIVDTYLERGHRVVVLDNLSTGQRSRVAGKAAFIEMDILDDEVAAVFEREKFDAVNHQAAQISVTHSVADPAGDAEVNILGSLKLLQLAVKHKVGRFLFASTGGAIYGEQDSFPADETHKSKPTSPYGLSKLAVENYLTYYRDTFGLSTVALRYSNVYGPRQEPEGEAGVVAIFCDLLKRGQPPVIFGDGEQTRDFIAVQDVVQANLAMLESDLSGAYNVGTGHEISINRLAEILIGLAGNGIKREYRPSRLGEQLRSVINGGKLERALGWRAAMPLEEGLRLTFDYFRARP